ncbi:MAG: cold shock domain-containing protein [Candidatus Dadabacteria bacterium]|nr:cold shock domain-containing protein [Candidatus Dadabacteria bacterium]
MKGKINKLISDRGFGFIGGEDGQDVFFHLSSLVDADFESLSEGQDVEYELEESPSRGKGPRASSVRLAE